MKQIKTILMGLAALMAIALPTASNAVFVDLSGIVVDGDEPTVFRVQEDEEQLDPFNIFYSLNIYHVWPSQGLETNVTLFNDWIFEPVNGTVEISGNSDCSFGDQSGHFKCTGSVKVTDASIFPRDEWTITLSDSYDDWLDYIFLDGSYLAWGDDAPSSVPEPSVLLLMGAGILGFSLTRRYSSKR
jgi:hypothetical protein